MANLQQHESDSDDSAPESISFDIGKQKNAQQNQKIKEQINKIREVQKQKRIERQEKYIEQKKKKFENLKLSEDVLENIGKKSASNKRTDSAVKVLKRKKHAALKPSKKIFNDEETDLIKNSISDFIPLKTYSNYGISVVNLEQTNKKPLIASDRAKAFKNTMFNRPGIRRQTADESLALAKKRKLVKS